MSISVVEAGKKGGLTILRKKGREYFREIGKNGQRAMRKKHPGMAREWGTLGGRPRKHSLNNEGEASNKE